MIEMFVIVVVFMGLVRRLELRVCRSSGDWWGVIALCIAFGEAKCCPSSSTALEGRDLLAGCILLDFSFAFSALAVVVLALAVASLLRLPDLFLVRLSLRLRTN